MKKQTAKTCIISFMNDGYLLSANTLAKMTGYTPQHINRVFKQLFNEGRVSFATIPHQGNSRFARKWCAAHKTALHREYTFTNPPYIQTEMELK